MKFNKKLIEIKNYKDFFRKNAMRKTFGILFTIFLFIFLLGNKSWSQSGALQYGLLYLSGIQNPDGSWSENITSDFCTTFEVIETFRLLNKIDDSYERGFQWSQSFSNENIDYLTKRIILLSRKNMDAQGELSTLTSLQDVTIGGWGVADFFMSDIIDTALAIAIAAMTIAALLDVLEIIIIVGMPALLGLPLIGQIFVFLVFLAIIVAILYAVWLIFDNVIRGQQGRIIHKYLGYLYA